MAANVDVVVGENHRLASGVADALQDEGRRIGAGRWRTGTLVHSRALAHLVKPSPLAGRAVAFVVFRQRGVEEGG